MSLASEGYTFTKEAGQRIVAAVKQVEGSPIFSTGRGRGRTAVPAANFYWTLRGKLNGDLTQGGSASMTVWFFNPGTGEEEAGTGQIDVYDWLLKSGQKIASGKKVIVDYDLTSDRYYVTSAECG